MGTDRWTGSPGRIADPPGDHHDHRGAGRRFRRHGRRGQAVPALLSSYERAPAPASTWPRWSGSAPCAARWWERTTGPRRPTEMAPDGRPWWKRRWSRAPAVRRPDWNTLPGAFASLEELVALCRPLAARRLPYATHMRNEDDRVLEAIDEAMAVARGAGCPLQISHLKMQGPRNWAKLDQAFARIDTARQRRDGHRLRPLSLRRLPDRAHQPLPGLEPGRWDRRAFCARLDDSTVAGRIRAEALAKVELIGGWDNVLIASVRAGEDSAARDSGSAAYAASPGQDPYERGRGTAPAEPGDVGMVGLRHERGQPRPDLRPPAGHGVQRRRRATPSTARPGGAARIPGAWARSPGCWAGTSGNGRRSP